MTEMCKKKRLKIYIWHLGLIRGLARKRFIYLFIQSRPEKIRHHTRSWQMPSCIMQLVSQVDYLGKFLLYILAFFPTHSHWISNHYCPPPHVCDSRHFVHLHICTWKYSSSSRPCNSEFILLPYNERCSINTERFMFPVVKCIWPV